MKVGRKADRKSDDGGAWERCFQKATTQALKQQQQFRDLNEAKSGRTGRKHASGQRLVFCCSFPILPQAVYVCGLRLNLEPRCVPTHLAVGVRKDYTQKDSSYRSFNTYKQPRLKTAKPGRGPNVCYQLVSKAERTAWS
ncbi:hypothetical protein GGTG_12497 [Gaeumannomyces tritici R3-111a-1]|uniref:Uncharacterized protein n=1 Tax=Gaeumannomyces tritici (strain R3-111a-1) TaxID=644352 RepID=J3PG71_GAET3|nr:hypothetical protein GGTG_12497 [Gaeumannomyces tritici R3-111a-1]EJT70325.1 hypothetical protein GGTG_12497 [Gaeumannomyces tritici R3-111a-1]